MTSEVLGTMTEEDRAALAKAVRLLEESSFAAKLAESVGVPVTGLIGRLPGVVSAKLRDITSAAMLQSLKVAISTLDERSSKEPSLWLPKMMTMVTGGVGGLFGLPALAVELPVTTTVMLRSIAEIARSEGENLRSARTRLACLEVFALGGKGMRANADMGYYAVRAVLTQTMNEAATYLLEKGVAETSAPVLMRLVSAVASRFGVVVSEKIAAAAVPIVGAVGGATVNLVFMDYFQNLARGHFVVRRLERKYGAAVVRSLYMDQKDRRSAN